MDRDKAFLQRLRKLIKIKLTELEVYVDDELVDYITVLLVNKKTASQMIEDLNLFLNEHSESFVIWLFNTCENFNTHETSYDNDTKLKKSRTKLNLRDVKKRKDSSCSNDDKTSTKTSAELKSRGNVYEREPKQSKRQHISPLPEKTRKRHARTSNNSHKDDQTNKVKHEEVRRHADGNKGTNTVKNTTVYPKSQAEDKSSSKNVAVSESNYTLRDFIDVQANEGYDNVLYENHVEHIQEKQEHKINKFTTELANSNSANLIVSTQDLLSNSNSNLTPTIVQSSVMKILHGKKNIASESLFLKALHNADLRLKINQNNKEVTRERQKLPLTLDEVQQQRLVRFGNVVNDSKRSVAASVAPETSYESELTPAGKRFKEDYPVEPSHASSSHTVNSDMEEASINSIVTSPKFIVTLDPVARTRGESRKVVFVETPTHDPTPHLASPKRYRTTPFAGNATSYQPDQGSFVGEASISMADFPDDDNVMEGVEGIEQEGRIMERCKFWPGCKNGENCLYHHPTIQCKNFPQCSFGDKCLFIHPNCKFDAACTKKDCPFTHASVRKDLNNVSKPQVINLPLSSNRNSPFSGVSNLVPFKVPCKFGSSCFNIGCPYLHFPECKYGIQCTRLDCMFTHPNESTNFKSKTKWVSPCYRPSNPVPPRNESANGELNRSHTMIPME